MNKLIFIVILFVSSANCIAQVQTPEKHNEIRKTIEQLNAKEREAFVQGDCEKVVSYFAENATFYANGRKAPSKEVILGVCKNIPRPFEPSASINDQVFVLSESVAYNVKTIDFPIKEGDKTRKVEVVTRIWHKTNDGWKIVHLHSSVSQQPI